jgi:hypothetical protein
MPSTTRPDTPPPGDAVTEPHEVNDDAAVLDAIETVDQDVDGDDEYVAL